MEKKICSTFLCTLFSIISYALKGSVFRMIWKNIGINLKIAVHLNLGIVESTSLHKADYRKNGLPAILIIEIIYSSKFSYQSLEIMLLSELKLDWKSYFSVCLFIELYTCN